MVARPVRKPLVLLLAALAALPLSGCLTDPHRPLLLQASGIFPFHAKEPGAPGTQPISSCAELAGMLRERALEQARVLLDQAVQQQSWMRGEGDVAVEAVPMAADAAAGASGTREHSAAGAQATGTNNQETGADEGDLVKTDGEWSYVLSSGILHVLRSRTVGGLEEVGNVTLAEGASGGELLLERRAAADPKDDRLVAVLGGQSAQGQMLVSDTAQQRTSGAMTRVVVLSLADRKAPAIEQESWVEGAPQGARLVDGTAYVIVERQESMLGLRTWVGPDGSDLARLGLSQDDYQSMGEKGQAAIRGQVARLADADNQRQLDGMDLGDLLPLILRQHAGFLVPDPADDDACRSVLAMPDATGRSFTTILAIGVRDAGLPSKSTEVLGGSAVVYADTGALVLAAPTLDSWWSWAQPGIQETTDLLWFDLDGLSVTQRAAGRVPGIVMDSFALDVHGGALRVTTTTGTWNRGWGPSVALSSQVLVLDDVAGTLVARGQVGGIAPGEHLWSVRFTDDRAYLVTFRQMDPLWVVDLAGAVPRILGELHVAGVSSYIHPLGDDQLLTIGYGAGPNDLGLDESRIVVSLFDVRDPKHPRLQDTLDLAPPSGWASSGALHEHRAFTYWDAVATLAVPITSSSADGSGGQRLALDLVGVDRAAGRLSLRGEADQDRLLAATSPGWWGSAVERSWFLGFPQEGPVSVYAMSPLGVTSNDLATLQPQHEVRFPPPAAPAYGCCRVD